MNVLIVDDDVSMVRRLRERIDWRRYGIATVLSAYCVRSAQEIMEEFPVDILFCDIEMPQGSGLELVAWARERGYPVEVIFLTCHSEFDYARQAIAALALDRVAGIFAPCKKQRDIKEEKRPTGDASPLCSIPTDGTEIHVLLAVAS